MESIQLNPLEHLERILKNPGTLVDKERALSESTYPLLAAYYQWLRKINSVHTKLDVAIQNQQELSEFIFLCEHNLLFFLTVTGRFDVIRTLYSEHKLSGKERRLIYLIQKEREQAHKQQDGTGFKMKTPANIVQTLESVDWQQYARSLSNMHLYSYYQQEIKRVSQAYHLQQTQIVNNAYKSRTQRLFRAIEIINADKALNKEVKAEADRLYVYYSGKIHAASGLENGGQTYDLKILEEQYAILLDKYKQSEEIVDFLRKHAHLSPQLQELLEEEEKQTALINEELERNKRQYQEEMRELNVHWELARANASADVEKNLHHIIHFITKCPKEHFSAEQKIALNKSLVHLKEFKKQFKNADSYDEMQLLLKKCTVELNLAYKILKPALPQHALHVFQKEIELFEEAITKPTEFTEDGFNFMSDLTTEEGLSMSWDAPAMENKEDKEKIDPDSPEVSLVPPPAEQPGINLKNYKLHLKILRNDEEPITLHTEEQLKLKAQLNGLLKSLKKIKEDELINPGDLSQIKLTEEIIEKIKLSDLQEVRPVLLKSLFEQIIHLGDQYSELDVFKETIATITKELTHHLQHEVKI